jgi:hypothetical protein
LNFVIRFHLQALLNVVHLKQVYHNLVHVKIIIISKDDEVLKVSPLIKVLNLLTLLFLNVLVDLVESQDLSLLHHRGKIWEYQLQLFPYPFVQEDALDAASTTFDDMDTALFKRTLKQAMDSSSLHLDAELFLFVDIESYFVSAILHKSDHLNLIKFFVDIFISIENQRVEVLED